MQTVTTTSALPFRAPRTPKPWTAHLTFDLVALLLSRSIFHSFISFLIPLCLLATHRPASSPSVAYTFYWACLVTCYHGLAAWNHRLAEGAARKVELEGEVVLVAGGCGGLGRLLVEVYAMKGVAGLAVLDVRVPESKVEREEWEERGVRWFECDVSRREEVERVRGEVVKEFGTHPTILINAIAAPITSSPLTTLTTPQFTNTISSNLTSHFNLLSIFLPAILHNEPETVTGGTVVTCSSILSHLPPAHLAPYSASKAALTSLHHTLTAEIRNLHLAHRVKAILVETGQMQTRLFEGVETPSRFWAPILETREVCKAITNLVDAGEGGVIRLPTYAGWVAWYAVLPVAVQRLLRWGSGIDRAMVGGRVAVEHRRDVSEKKRERTASMT